MKAFLSILLVVFSIQAAAAQELTPAEVKSLLAEIRQKRAAAPQVQADFREEKTMKLMNKPVVTSGKVWFQAPNKFRREVTGNSPSITVSDGQKLWIYYPKLQTAEQYTLGRRSPLDAGIATITASLNLQGVESKYVISGQREGDGYVLQLLPRSGSTKKLLKQFMIRLNKDLQVERTEMLQPNGDRVVTVYSNESRGRIPAGTFSFEPPAGTNVTTPLGR